MQRIVLDQFIPSAALAMMPELSLAGAEVAFAAVSAVVDMVICKFD
jgi:hypothetical protein